MAPGLSKATRFMLGLPLLGLAVLCFLTMDPEKLMAHQQPFLESGKIEFEGKSINILKRFHYFEFLDDIWRGATVTFSPSTLGYDSISSRQMFSFLHDLGPVYAVWFLESCRVGNRFTPAYFPTIFIFAGQLLGFGSAAPVFYFLVLVVGPSPSELARSGRGRQLITRSISFLLPIILLLHTAEVFAAFCSETPEARHYWTWAWQMAHLEIGVLNLIVAVVFSIFTSAKTTRTGGASPAVLLAVLGSVSTGVWLHTILPAPYSISDIFVPDQGGHSDFISHTRWALQLDELSGFASSFIWLVYSLLDLRAAGIERKYTILPVALFPLMIVCLGPGSAFALGWYWKEVLIHAGMVKRSKLWGFL